MKTKRQIREEGEKAALRQRIADIASGAAGLDFDAEDEFATADFLSRFIPALKTRFEAQSDKRDYLWYPGNLDNFDRVESTTEFLWNHGIRAAAKSTGKRAG